MSLSEPAVVYVTPAGFMCTCGGFGRTLTGASARRAAEKHIINPHCGNPEIKIIDYRETK